MLQSLALPPFHQNDRPLVVLPRAHDVIDHAENANTDEHNRRPVEGLESGGVVLGPEAPEEGVNGVQDTKEVDRDAPLAEGPSTLGEKLRRSDAAVEDGADGAHVGNHEGDDVEGDDYDRISSCTTNAWLWTTH